MSTYDDTPPSPLTQAILRTAFHKAIAECEDAGAKRDAYARLIAARVCNGATVASSEVTSYLALEEALDEAREREAEVTAAYRIELGKPSIAERWWPRE